MIELTTSEEDIKKGQSFIDEYNELCKKHGIKLQAITEIRLMNIEEVKEDTKEYLPKVSE